MKIQNIQVDSQTVATAQPVYSTAISLLGTDSNGTPIDLQGYVTAYTATQLAMVINKQFVGSAYLGINATDKPTKYSLMAQFPVLNRNYQW